MIVGRLHVHLDVMWEFEEPFPQISDLMNVGIGRNNKRIGTVRRVYQHDLF
jgi:hypothetical protein